MKTFWENDGQPNANGEVVACIDMEDGSGMQRFVGANEKEVADKLLAAQGNATKKIREQSRAHQPEPAKAGPSFASRVLTADERFTLAHDLTDPAKAPEAIRSVVEATIGAPLEVVRESIVKDDAERRADDARAEAIEFAEETPDYVKCPHNANTIARYMQTQGWAPVKANFAKAYEELKAAGLVVLQPITPNGEPAPQPDSTQPNGGLPAQPAVSTRPRGTASSSGIRNGDSSATPTIQRTPTSKYTIEQIEAMPQEAYRYKLANEPGFAAAVDALYAPKK